MRITHSWTDDTATIKVEGLEAPVTMLHVTDPHVGLVDERDSDYLQACEAFNDKNNVLRRHDAFPEMMGNAGDLEIDVVALTGDIVSFPSQAAIEFVSEALSKLDTEVLYTCGNHDWHFPGLDGREELREKWWPVLNRLHGGEPEFSVRERGGIQFMLLDDSTYQISEAQLDFARGVLDNGKPTVLLTHIPMSTATLRPAAIERWEAPILIGDPDWGPNSREKWEAGEDRQSTVEFVRTISRAENLVAVFCGHIHFPHADALGPTAIQYVGAPAFDSRWRIVEFLPL